MDRDDAATSEDPSVMAGDEDRYAGSLDEADAPGGDKDEDVTSDAPASDLWFSRGQQPISRLRPMLYMHSSSESASHVDDMHEGLRSL